MIPALFGRIAPAYDRMNRILSLGSDLRWRRMAAASIPGAPGRILDIACGTGDFALALARGFPGAEVVCLDPSPEMLDIARRKTAAAGLSGRIEFMEGRAEALPAADGAFDLVSCAFGFRNFSDVPAAFAGCARALKRGGLLAVLEFTRPRCAAMRAALSCWLRAASVFAGAHRADYAHLRRSIASTFSAGEFAEMARRAGFSRRAAKLFLPACRFFLFSRD